MDLTIAGHPFVDGDRVRFAPESIKFTCAQDSGASIKSYPRVTDPWYNKWVGVQVLDANQIRVQVGVSSNITEHTWSSANANAVVRAVVYNDVGSVSYTHLTLPTKRIV